jgi:hypothetical protein
MPLKPYHGYEPICPVCGSTPQMGSDSYPLFRTYADAREYLQETDGDTMEEKIANSCEGLPGLMIGCGDLWHHRRCITKPCGYCSSKRGGWLTELAEAATKMTVAGDREGHWFMLRWWWDIVTQKRRIEREKRRQKEHAGQETA